MNSRFQLSTRLLRFQNNAAWLRRFLAAGTAALALWASGAPASAQAADTPALDFASLGSGFDYTQGSYTLGWSFTTKQDISVTALGFYDDLQNGLTTSHPVGIFDSITKEQVATATVVPADPLTGFFRYHALPTPVTLRGGRSYFAFALTFGENYAVAPSQLLVNPFITFTGYAGADSNNSSQTELSPPDASSYGYGYPNSFHGDFGPSFKIADAPAPTTAAVDFPALLSSYNTGTDAYAGPFSTGYLFRPTQDIQVATLGFYDDQKNGLTQGHSVAIFDAVAKTLVVNTNITNADPLRGFFRYHDVSHVTLKKGFDYFIMADNTNDNYAKDVSDVLIDSSVTLRGGAFNPSAPTLGPDFPTQSGSDVPIYYGPTFEVLGTPVHPPFFSGETGLANEVYYLQFASGNPFGYYSYLTDPHYIYHQDLGYEYVFDANDGKSGVYLYDFKSGGFFYTSPGFPFPYLYDFTLNSTLYYYPDPNNAGRYNTNGTRYFYEFKTGQIITK